MQLHRRSLPQLYMGHSEVTLLLPLPSSGNREGGAVIVELTHTTRAVGGGLVASAQEQAVVAELMAPSERPVGDPPLFSPTAEPNLHLLISPTDPVDDPDDE